MRLGARLAACAGVASAWPTYISSDGASGSQAPLALPDPPQEFAQPSSGSLRSATSKKLHGRFIHITDIHPDPYYVTKGRYSSSCHRKKPKREQDRGGYWGGPYSSKCDSPDSLVNLTMEWLAEEWADKVDFVIWTGDNARHDSDRKVPRTAKEIFALNRRTAAQMEQAFSTRGVPLVPSIGNNDMYPHNIMYRGPNEVTQQYRDIWKNMIPFPSYQVFQRGAYYSVELVPDHLAALSLNTLYWYDSNKAVDGCLVDSDDPGRLQLEWLEVQLDHFRRRKMQVWLTGHVPPTLGNYYPECYRGYAQLALRFQDTIVGHLYGHMNVDHFFWIDVHEMHHIPDLAESAWSRLTSMFTKKRHLLSKTLLEDFKSLPPKKSEVDNETEPINYDDYVIVNVGPSIVPTYAPSVRVFTYNITGWGETPSDLDAEPIFDDYEEDEDDEDGNENDEDDWIGTDEKRKRGKKRRHGHRHDPGRIDCTKRKNRNEEECLFPKPRHANKHSPSRRNRLWSPLGYTQWYIPDLGTHKKSDPPRFQIEYMTYQLSSFTPPSDWPVPTHLLPASLRNLTEIPEGMESELVPFGLKDLTIPSWIKFARRLGRKKKLWKRFKLSMFLGGEEE